MGDVLGQVVAQTKRHQSQLMVLEGNTHKALTQHRAQLQELDQELGSDASTTLVIQFRL